MKKLKSKFKKMIKRVKNVGNVLTRIRYTNYYEQLEIKQNIVLAQAYSGMNFYGNMYYILKEMISRKECENFEFYVGVRKEDRKEIKKFINNTFDKKIKILNIGSKKYLKILASAKYLFNNVAFPTYFIKKEGQIYLNTWHGTPLKGLGRSIMDAPNESGNYQRNFLMTDYLLFPNEYTFNCMREDYMINNFFVGKYVLNGYPRNSVFYDDNLKKELRKKYQLENKEIIIYMPTWRRKPQKGEEDIQVTKCIEFVKYLEENLKENQVLYVKLHNLVNDKINFEKYKKVKLFPKDCETYEFLAISDALITDYSSVMFDYLNCNKKIILYTYDLEEYINGRSVYFDIQTLPFPMCTTLEEVYKELKKINKTHNYDSVKKKFCTFDNLNSSKQIVDLILNKKEKDIKIIEGKKYQNNKPNALIYCGKLSIGKTAYNLLNSLSELPKNINFYLNFYNNKVEKNKFVINEFPKDIYYITLQGPRLIKISEAICYRLYYKYNIKNDNIIKKINNIYNREIKRLYPGIKFDYLVCYNYGTPIINMYSLMHGEKYLFIHKPGFKAKRKLRTLELNLTKFNKLYANNTKINEFLKENYNNEINAEYYPDNLKEFKKFIKEIFK